MTASEVVTQVAAIVREVLPAAPPSPDASLLAAGLDSIGMVALLNEVEARLEVSIPPEAVVPHNFDSIRTIAQLVERLRA